MSETVDRVYERVLVLRCQTGDEAAFTEIVTLHHARLRYYVSKMLGPAGEPDDVTQEVWLDAFRSIGRLNDVGAFRGWLYRIARDRVFRRFRGPRPPLPLDVSAGGEIAEEEDGFSAEDAARVHAALDTLTPDHREVLVLRFLEEMDYEQIAGVIGEPVGTVRSRLHYAKRALRRAIERMDGHG